MKEFFVNPLGNASCYPRKERVLEKLYTKVQLVNEREKDQNHRRGFGNRYAR